MQRGPGVLANRHSFHEAIQQRYRFHKAIPQRTLMRAVGSLCENGNAVVSLRENSDVSYYL